MVGGGAGHSPAERGTPGVGRCHRGPQGRDAGPGSALISPGKGQAPTPGTHLHLGDTRLRGQEASSGLWPQVSIAWGSLNKLHAPHPAH